MGLSKMVMDTNILARMIIEAECEAFDNSCKEIDECYDCEAMTRHRFNASGTEKECLVCGTVSEMDPRGFWIAKGREE